MRRIKLYTFLLLMAGSISMQAQELNEIISSPNSWVYRMIFEDDHTFVANKTVVDDNDNVMEIQVVRMNDDGEELASQLIFDSEEYADVVWLGPLKRGLNGGYVNYFAKVIDGISYFYKVSILDDLTLNFQQLDWETDDYYDDDRTFYPYNTGLVINKDGCAIITYPPHSQYNFNGTEAIQFLKFDAEGHLVGQRLIEGLRGQYNHNTFPTPDSLGCRILLQNNGSAKLDCHTLDADLNTIAVKENVDELSWPFMTCRYAYLCTNPTNGRTYSINTFSYPAVNGNPEIVADILMSAFAADDFCQLSYTWGIATPQEDNGGVLGSIGFDNDENVYMAGEMDPYVISPWVILNKNLYITCMDKDLNKYHEIYHIDDYAYRLVSLAAIPSGGCIISCHRTDTKTGERDRCMYKISKETFLSIDEAHDAGFSVAIAYPNPGKDVLNIRTALQNARIEIYDLSGKLIHNQQITDNITPITTTSWPSGTYIWKVIANGKEAESGKWIKE